MSAIHIHPYQSVAPVVGIPNPQTCSPAPLFCASIAASTGLVVTLASLFAIAMQNIRILSNLPINPKTSVQIGFFALAVGISFPHVKLHETMEELPHRVSPYLDPDDYCAIGFPGITLFTKPLQTIWFVQPDPSYSAPHILMNIPSERQLQLILQSKTPLHSITLEELTQRRAEFQKNMNTDPQKNLARPIQKWPKLLISLQLYLELPLSAISLTCPWQL